TDLPRDDVEQLLPERTWIGLSTNSDTQLELGVGTAATYFATGPVFATATKSQPDPVVGLGGVTRAALRLRGCGRPLVAIGGISLETAPSRLRPGGDSL